MSCAVEDELIFNIISNDSGAAMQFRLAPAYALYLVLRSCVSSPGEPEWTASQRDKRISLLASKMAQYLQQIVQVHLILSIMQ